MIKLKKIENNKKTSNKKSKKGSLIFVTIFLFLSFFIGFAGGALAYNFFMNSNNVTIDNTPNNVSSGPINSMATFQVVELVENSVVEVRTEIKSSDYSLENSVVEGAGSGVILTSDGYIATNSHVVEDASVIKVKLHNGNEYTANLIGENKKEDIAVIKIDVKDLSPISFGNSDEIKVGERVIVIGNPLGTLGGSVTDGIVSATNRTLTIDGEQMNLLQTNAEINHGNSGGGMFGERGQFVGLVVAKSSGMDLEGLGFAIPSNKVKEVVNKLMQ